MILGGMLVIVGIYFIGMQLRMKQRLLSKAMKQRLKNLEK